MPIVQDQRYTQSQVAGPINTGLFAQTPVQEPPPGTLDVLSSALRQSSIAGAGYERLANHDPDMPDAPPNWDALDHIQGFEDFASDLADAQTPSDLEGAKSRIRGMQDDREVLHRAGFAGTAAELGTTLLDPSFLVAAAVPELALGKSVMLGKTLTAIARGAVGASAYEAGMQSLQESRSAADSAINITGGALLSGVLGHLLNRIPESASKSLRNTIDAEAALVRSESGSAAVARPTTLGEESIATGAKGLSSAMAKTPLVGTDLDKIMTSESVTARTALQDLADVPQILEKNKSGIATPTSVEAMVSKHDARVADFMDLAQDQWKAYRERVPKDERIGKKDFYASIASASRRGDTIGIPEADEAAKFLRSRVFDPLKEDAQKLGLMDDPVKEALAKAETQAVEEFVKVESGQIYGDYAAKARAQIMKRREFRNKVRDRVSEPGDYQHPEIEDAANSIRDLMLQSAVKQEQGGAALTNYARRTRINKIMDEAYAAHEKRLEPQSEKAFAKRAAKVTATETDPDVQRMAKLLRDQNEGSLKNRVKPKTVDPEKAAKPVGAESYFRRMYDRDVIRANLPEWHQVLYSWFANQGKAEPAEVTAAVEDVTRKILHADVGQANFASKVTVPAAGPLKERTLAIPDALIERFLINDPIRVARAYVRELAPQVEMAKRFGDVDMKQQIQSVTDEYNIKREAARSKEGVSTAEKAEELKRLTDQEKNTLEAIVRIRDRVLGRAGRLSPDAGEGERRAVMAVRGWRNFVASSKLGGTALTGGLMDVAKITAQYGFLPTMRKLTQLATSKEFRALSFAQARRIGSAVEVSLSRRVQVAYEGALTEGWTQKMADGVYKYTGLSHMTDFTRTLSATLMENSVLKAAEKVAAGKTLQAFERSRLASLGLGDDEMAGIAKQIAEHGGEVDGIRVSGSADWTDKRLADIYDAAILKESKIAVQQPGAADRVWWMDSETGKFLGQLKTFSLSSPARLLSGGLQMAGNREYAKAARFFGFMMIGGYLTHSLRQLVAGKLPTTDPLTAGSEAIAESGLLGVLPDVASPLTRRLGLFGESVRYADRSPYAAYGGPSVGALGDTWDVLYNRTQGGISASDLHALRRILPYQNVWWLRREINALEGELAEGLDLKGADAASFGERFARTEAMHSKGSGPLVAQAAGVQQ